MGENELRELQHQTRMMAEKEASDGFVAVGSLLAAGVTVWWAFWPQTFPPLPFWAWAAIVVGVAGAVAIRRYIQLTRHIP